MPRGRPLFRERDLRRALRAAEKEHKPVCGAEIDARGNIRVIFGEPRGASDELDQELAQFEARHGQS